MRAALLLVLLPGCDSFFPAIPARCADAPADVDAPAAPVWHRDVRPLIEARCSRCHVDSGIAPFPLTTYAETLAHADAVQDAVTSRAMPPWMPAHCCRAYKHDTSLTPQQIATITAWLDAGAPEGDPADVGAPLPPVAGLPRVDLELEMPDAYRPKPADGKRDDFRCFLVDWPLETTQFVTGFDLVPSDRHQLHHAIVYVAKPDELERFVDEDANAPGPGWPCPGGVLLGLTGYVGGWGPGRDGQLTPEGRGHEVTRGSALVLAMHYARHDGGDFSRDRSKVQLVLADDVNATLRSVWIYNGWWPAGTMRIPAGEKDVRHSVQIDPTDYYSRGRPIEILGAAFHMHEHGVSGSLGVRRADGSTECLLQIDAWDPDWQTDHEFAEPVTVRDGDQIFIECRFDNPTDDDLYWAEDGEMCIAFLTAQGDLR